MSNFGYLKLMGKDKLSHHANTSFNLESLNCSCAGGHFSILLADSWIVKRSCGLPFILMVQQGPIWLYRAWSLFTPSRWISLIATCSIRAEASCQLEFDTFIAPPYWFYIHIVLICKRDTVLVSCIGVLNCQRCGNGCHWCRRHCHPTVCGDFLLVMMVHRRMDHGYMRDC